MLLINAGSVIHIGGLYSDEVFYIALSVGITFIISYIGLQVILLRHQFDFLDEMKESTQSTAQSSPVPSDKLIESLETYQSLITTLLDELRMRQSNASPNDMGTELQTVTYQ